MKEFIELITGGQPLSHTAAFVFFALMGMLTVKIWRYNLKKKRLLREKPPVIVNFSWRIWISDNLLDFVCAFLVANSFHVFLFDILLFVGKYFNGLPSFSNKMFYGLLLGWFFQYVMHKLLNKVKI